MLTAKRDLPFKLALVLLGAMVLVAQRGPDVAADTAVNATICGPESQPTIVIDSPNESTQVVASPLQIVGSVHDVNQVDIRLDDVYNQTVAIGTGQDYFSAPVEVSNGTHTIEVKGINGACSVSKRVVVTVALQGSTAVPDTSVPAASGNTIAEMNSFGKAGVVIQTPDDTTKRINPTPSVANAKPSDASRFALIDVFGGRSRSEYVSLILRTFWILLFLLATVVLVFAQTITNYWIFKKLRPLRNWLPYIALVLMLLAVVAST